MYPPGICFWSARRQGAKPQRPSIGGTSGTAITLKATRADPEGYDQMRALGADTLSAPSASGACRLCCCVQVMLLEAFQKLATKQHAANGQKDEEAMADHGSWYLNEANERIRAVIG